jgi:hypothetical protein
VAQPESADAPAPEDFPVFSTGASTHEVSVRSTGGAVGTFHGVLILGTVLTTLVCAATMFAFLAALARPDRGSWLLTVAMIIGTVVSLGALYVLGTSVAEEFQRTAVGVWVGLASLGTGLLLGGGAVLLTTDLTAHATAGATLPYVVEPTAVGGLAAIAGIVGAVMTISAARRAARTPRPGAIVAGTIVAVPAPVGWDAGNPYFTGVLVTYADADRDRTLAVTMRTTPQRVPAEGSAVLVTRDSAGRTRVTGDPDHPFSFDAVSVEYEDPDAAASGS